MAAIVAIMFVLTAAFGFAQGGTPQVGSALPEMELTKPKDAVALRYLGLSAGGDNFHVSEVKAQALIIEVYSMYCPYCQAEAPKMNKLHQLIENNPASRGKIKIIGIGVGNSLFETGVFRKKYDVKFPLIPDGDFKLHKVFGETRTPYFIVVKLEEKKQPQVIYSRLGAIENVELFLAQIAQLSGVK